MIQHTISVIVCAYTEKRWNDLVEGVAALKQQTLSPNEILVVIDHNDDLFDKAQSEISGITLLKNKNARGLSGARNTGIAHTTSDIITFIDEDAVADADWLAKLTAPFTEESVLGVGGQIIPMWQEEQPGWFPEEFNWVVGCVYKGMPTTTAPVRNLIGCNMSFRREVFDTVGGFRENIGRIGTLPVGCEETELCIRTHQQWHESNFIYEPSAVVHHRVPASRGTWQYFTSRCYSEGISKALISKYVGTEAGLSSERSYVMRTLPIGVLLGLSQMLRGDFKGGIRALAIIIGLMSTGVGFLAGNWQQWRKKQQQHSDIQVASQS